MIDFACKKFDLNEIIRCGLGLSKAELKILKFFLDNRDEFFKTQEVSKKIKLELSTIQRAVKKLYEIEIVDRKQMNLSNGGYIFTYKIKGKSIIRNKIMNILQIWNKKVEEELDKW